MTIDGKEIETDGAMTVYEAACRLGTRIPTLCHREGVHPVGGCGLCTVEDTASGRLLPACVTRAEPGMTIETASAEALQARRDALELLLSNHPADCEAPCQLACPSGLPVPRLLEAVAAGRFDEATALARAYPFVCAGAAPCEKACRRKPLGGAVAICALHLWLAGASGEAGPRPALRRFRSRMAGLSKETLLSLCAETGDRRMGADASEVTHESAVYEAARCLQCGCLRPDDCRLRERCEEAGAKQATFAGGCGAVVRQRSAAGLRFDSSRCVLCGLCVRTGERLGASLAPAFHGRGFDAQIGPPLGRTWDDVPVEVQAACAAACPTGAMAFSADRK